ncbi:MAG: hypothetical protein F4169_22130 [Gammaproteobacteria bacterium]|nr:hypothetical protein [Gammaproteobacteria bacterium]MYF31498.1 hypothetical protein [Gammaproteobacteria bacterium]MYK28609.1 hypothetical protein [Gammaproteobacteria bacterium]
MTRRNSESNNILFLIGTGPHRNDNHRRLPKAFADEGCRVEVADHASLHLDRGIVKAADMDLGECDLIWPLGFGERRSFFDRAQLLRRIDQGRFVNVIDAYTYLHGKLAFLEHLPETHAGSDAVRLIERLDDRSDWIVKPSGTSFGQGVARIRNNADGHAAVRRTIREQGFAILQRYVESAADCEIRCIVAGGEVIGCYRRLPKTGEHRANLATGATAAPYTLSAAEHALAQAIATQLSAVGIGFAALDIAHPYLIETNIANPGGLGTIEALSEQDLAPRVADAIIKRHEPTGTQA